MDFLFVDKFDTFIIIKLKSGNEGIKEKKVLNYDATPRSEKIFLRNSN